MAQDTVTNLAEVIAEVNALDEKIDGEVSRIDDEIGEVNGNLANSLSSNGLTAPIKFGYDSENDVYGYIKAGADTVTPFSSFSNFILEYIDTVGSSSADDILTIEKAGTYICYSVGRASSISSTTGEIVYQYNDNLLRQILICNCEIGDTITRSGCTSNSLRVETLFTKEKIANVTMEKQMVGYDTIISSSELIEKGNKYITCAISSGGSSMDCYVRFNDSFSGLDGFVQSGSYASSRIFSSNIDGKEITLRASGEFYANLFIFVLSYS